MRKLLKIGCMILAFMLLIGNSGMALADVIFEPRDDFYETHQDLCQYYNRNYTAMGPNGTVTVYESPESDTVIVTLENGVNMHISWVYEDGDGIQWGYWENFKTDESGWVPMEYLELVYDSRSFTEENGDRILHETGALGQEYAGKTVLFWEYPGSETHYDIVYDESYAPEFSAVYTDDAGRRWGMVHYYMSVSGWICLEAPTADYETLFPDAQPATEPSVEESGMTEATEPVVEIVPKRTINVPRLAAAITLVVCVTIGMLAALKRKK